MKIYGIIVAILIGVLAGCGTTWDIITAETYGSNTQARSKNENISLLKGMINNPNTSYEAKLFAHYSLGALYIGQLAQAAQKNSDGTISQPNLYIDQDQREGFNLVYIDNNLFSQKSNRDNAKEQFLIVSSGIEKISNSSMIPKEEMEKKLAYSNFYIGYIEKQNGNFNSAIEYFNKFKNQSYITWYAKNNAEKEISSSERKLAEERSIKENASKEQERKVNIAAVENKRQENESKPISHNVSSNDVGDPIGQYITPVQANEKRIIYLYKTTAEHPFCGQNKRAAAYYKTGEELEKLAEGCWVEGAGRVGFKLYSTSGPALMTDVAREDIQFLGATEEAAPNNKATESFPYNVEKTWTYKPFSILSTKSNRQISDAYIANVFMCKTPASTLQETMDLIQNYALIESSKTDGTLTITSFRGSQEGNSVTVSLAVDEQSSPRLVRYVLVNGMPAIKCK
jgi:hypothetical protein